jgi:hypothetical protein
MAAIVLLLAVCSRTTLAQQQDADASPIAASVPDSAATKVFVLGTPHLSGAADRFEPAMVDSLIALLNAFGPDAVAVENLSGRQVAAMERWGGRHDRVVQQFAGAFLYHGRQVQSQTGWSWTAANQRADSLLALARSSDALASDTRLSLVQSLTAAYRFPNAVLQWRHLSPDARAAQVTLPDTTAAALTDRLTAANETYSIGVRLAHRRGQQRLYPIDHHGSKDLLLEIYRPLQKSAVVDSMRTAFKRNPVLRRADSLERAGLRDGSLLRMYRHRNSDVVAQTDVRLQWRPWLRANLPDDIGRTRLALWETRNLHMVGHIRRVTAQHPGGRVLVIVGSSHKPFFDAYLRQMMGVQVVEAADVLSSS